MSAILNSLNAHNFLIFQPILMILVSKFMVCRALSDKTYLLLGLRSPLSSILFKKSNDPKGQENIICTIIMYREIFTAATRQQLQWSRFLHDKAHCAVDLDWQHYKEILQS